MQALKLRIGTVHLKDFCPRSLSTQYMNILLPGDVHGGQGGMAGKTTVENMRKADEFICAKLTEKVVTNEGKTITDFDEIQRLYVEELNDEQFNMIGAQCKILMDGKPTAEVKK